MIRLHYYDNAKFFLIISVILGHLLQNNGMLDRVSVGIFDTIFMYAMPAFVFISGVFTPPRPSENGTFRRIAVGGSAIATTPKPI